MKFSHVLLYRIHFFLLVVVVADLVEELDLLGEVLLLQADALEEVQVGRKLINADGLLLVKQGDLDFLAQLVTEENLIEITEVRSNHHFSKSGQIKLFVSELNSLVHQVLAILLAMVAAAKGLVNSQGSVEQLQLEVTDFAISGRLSFKADIITLGLKMVKVLFLHLENEKLE